MPVVRITAIPDDMQMPPLQGGLGTFWSTSKCHCCVHAGPDESHTCFEFKRGVLNDASVKMSLKIPYDALFQIFHFFILDSSGAVFYDWLFRKTL